MADNTPGLSFPPTDFTDPQLTLRAVVTGLVIGAVLAPCNIYSGLKIGWAFNMSIAAALLGLAFWRLLQGLGVRPFGLLENTVNQTTASSAAAIVSSGLAAPIPAWTLITGDRLPWSLLTVWLLAVSLLGVVVAAGIRRQMLVRQALAFPAGVATAETLREIYGHGAEALARVRVLFTAAAVAAAVKLIDVFVVAIPRVGPAGAFGTRGIGLQQLGFVLEPSLLMIGFGAIVGLRVGLSLLFGAVLVWGVLAPWVVANGWAERGAPGEPWFGELVEWLLWPGVALMVAASLMTLALAWLQRRRGDAAAPSPGLAGEVPRRWFLAGAGLALVIAVTTQVRLFDIAVFAAVIAVLLSFVLAAVAARVAGETGITPIGAIGKVTQAAFAVISPGNMTNNLMAANVTGGATDQCADLLNDLKAGLLLGAQPRLQVLAQVFGIGAGSLAGSLAYIVLIPDPQAMLLTPEWPAPAVATWKAVAEVLGQGLTALPPGTGPAMLAAAAAGVLLVCLPGRWPWLGKWLPSAPALGLAFVIPASNSIALCLGAILAAVIGRTAPGWSARFMLALAAGLVAGESLAGIAAAARLFAGH